MSVSRGNHRCASPDIGVAPTRSLLPILPRLYGYPRGTSTAYAYIEFIAPVGAASSEQLQQHRARVAPLMPSRCDANLAAAGRLPCFARRAGRSPARSAARCRRSRSWRTVGLGEACEGHRHCARVGNSTWRTEPLSLTSTRGIDIHLLAREPPAGNGPAARGLLRNRSTRNRDRGNRPDGDGGLGGCAHGGRALGCL
jgi:hypothetical protein